MDRFPGPSCYRQPRPPRSWETTEGLIERRREQEERMADDQLTHGQTKQAAE